MYIFIEPVNEEEVQNIQRAQKERFVEYERSVLGLRPESESDEKENSKDCDSVTAQVKNEVHNDESDSSKQSIVEPDEGEPKVVQADVHHAKTSYETDIDKTEAENPDGISFRSDTPQDEVTAENGQTQSRLEATPQISDATGSTEAEEQDKTSSVSDNPQTETTTESAQTQASPETAQETSDTLDPAEPSKTKSILALVLTTRSKVNGNYRRRPEALSSNDEWQVEYSITEIASQARAWSLYESCKRRRKKILGKDQSDDSEENYYRQMIRKYCEKGREWRSKMDDWEKQRQRIVFQAGDNALKEAGQPSEEAPFHSNVDSGNAEDMQGVDDYLQWMYGHDGITQDQQVDGKL